MDALDLAVVGLLVLAVGDLAVLLSNRDSKVEWALRLILATALSLSALLLHQRDFDWPLLTLLAALGCACEGVLLWRRFVAVRQGQLRDDKPNDRSD
ncbi:hypothetical protein [Ralstonia sp. ASV6]|uniref:hypothetical protein n=1 Tax=Ralstonia sp. ASV6 TaxID=2795124 RepID=UPI0018EABE75|nr:hypothetical protein [Ralstonia sp. ASV6]